MRMQYHMSLFVLVVVLVFDVSQCAAFGKKVDIRTVWETENGTIRLVKEIGKAKGYHHPKEFYEDEMSQILSSLYYSQHEYLHWRHSTRVFEENQVRSLARPFQEAFLKAGPDDSVEFYFVARTQKLFGIAGESRAVRGRAFIENGDLHFQFDQMYQVQDEDPSKSENIDNYSSQMSWKLAPVKGQRYGMERDVLGKERENRHWVCINLQETLSSTPKADTDLQPAQVTPPATQEAPPSKTVVPEATASQKLRDLKKMLQDGLITQEDYDQKKSEILKSY